MDYMTMNFNRNGGSGTSDYSQLSNKPSINDVTLSGNKTSADLGLMPTRNIDLKPTKDSQNFVFSGGVYEADEKIKSSIEGMDTVYTEDGTPVDLPSYDVIEETEMQFLPTQDLHGYDKPWAGGAGKNKWDEEWELGIYNVDTGEKTPNNSYIRSTNAIPVSGGTQYYFYSNNIPARILFYDTNGDFLSTLSGWKANTTITTPADCAYVRFFMDNSYGTTYNNDIAFNYPATATSYEPYSNICPISGQNNATLTDEHDNKYIASLGGTYYGGRVFFENSGFIETIKNVSMSSLTWQRSRSGGFAAEIADAEIGKKFLACSILSPLGESFSWANFDNYPDNSISYSGGEGTGNKNVYVKCMSCDTLEEFQTLITNQQLAYELFTAITHRISVTREPLSRGDITYNGSALYISYQKDNVIGECKKFTVDEIAKLGLPQPPTIDGTYHLECSVSSGIPTITWVLNS